MKWSKFILPALVPLALVGCLDSGSSDSDEGGATSFDPISYVGEGTDLATFSSSNQDDFVGLLQVLAEIEESTDNIEEGLWTAAGFGDEDTSGNETLNGSCGGTVSFVFSVEGNGDYTETITADDYCDKNVFGTEVALDGKLVITGNYTGEDHTRHGFAYTDFYFVAESEETDMGLDGTISYNYLLTQRTTNVDLAIVDRTVSKSGFVDVVRLNDGDNGPKSFDGTVHVKDQGKATLTTTIESTSWDEGRPTSGEVEFVGTNTLTVTLNPGEPILVITD